MRKSSPNISTNRQRGFYPYTLNTHVVPVVVVFASMLLSHKFANLFSAAISDGSRAMCVHVCLSVFMVCMCAVRVVEFSKRRQRQQTPDNELNGETLSKFAPVDDDNNDASVDGGNGRTTTMVAAASGLRATVSESITHILHVFPTQTQTRRLLYNGTEGNNGVRLWVVILRECPLM